MMCVTKPFTISKKLVLEAYQRVKANKGSAGIDAESLEEFENNLKPNLYKIWNRMSSGCYFPPPVKAVSIPKKQGGERILGIPTVSDRIAQMVVKMVLEPDIEPIFLEDSYGYRPGRSAIDAIAVTRKRCWDHLWLIEFDIKGLFDNIPHDLLMKAVRRHTQNRWIILYVERWLKAPINNNGELNARSRGTPQGGVISPLLSNLFLHYVFDVWLKNNHPTIPWSRYADDGVLHCRTSKQAKHIMNQLKHRFEECGLEMHSGKSRIVCCANTNQDWTGNVRSFDYLGYTFRVRRSMNSKTGKVNGNFLPGVSLNSLNAMRRKIRNLKIHRWTNCSIEEIAVKINPIIQGWINYYAKFTRTAFYPICRQINMKLVKWARNKFKSLRNHKVKAIDFLERICAGNKGLFAHWKSGMVRSFV
jgi:RNA-directed DNA polymerase